MTSQLINISSLTKSFTTGRRDVEILKGIDFKVDEGEFIAIEGPSGCGKSTLLSIIGLLDTASAGEFLLCGQDVAGLSPYQLSTLRNRHIGWVFQNFNLLGDMTAAENIMLPLRYDERIKKHEYRQQVEKVLGMVELLDKIDQYPAELSGGQQQRIAIARALVTNPELILADEPTGNLDSDAAELVFSQLKQLNQKGVTVVMVTHSASLAAQCSRRYAMKDGRFITDKHDALIA